MAFVDHYDTHNELTLSQFERDDLRHLKAAASMAWDTRNSVWIIPWPDMDGLLEVLHEREYIVRCRSIDPSHD